MLNYRHVLMSDFSCYSQMIYWCTTFTDSMITAWLHGTVFSVSYRAVAGASGSLRATSGDLCAGPHGAVSRRAGSRVVWRLTGLEMCSWGAAEPCIQSERCFLTIRRVSELRATDSANTWLPAPCPAAITVKRHSSPPIFMQQTMF